MALLSFDVGSYHPWAQRSRERSVSDTFLPSEDRQKPWSAYGLLCLVLVIILAPQPSILLVCVKYYQATTQSRFGLLGHLTASYILLFIMLSSLLVTLVRDPGKVKPLKELEQNENDTSREDQVGEDNEDVSLADALLSREPGDAAEAFSLTPVKRNGESRWCRKCWAPKPERTHHCSECNRCVLKMDHHCPWLANRCVGARTYPSFLHFLLTATIYSAYICFLAIPLIEYYMSKPFLDEGDMVPYHTMTVALLSGFFSFTMGSFFIYHLYLTLTNQTTLESLAPMLLLQYLPDIPSEPTTQSEDSRIDDVQPPPFTSQPSSPTNISMTSLHRSQSPPPYTPPPSGQRRSQLFAEPFRFPSPPPPPQRFRDHELNRNQRQLTREAHSRIRVYDLGWKNNLLEVLGGPTVVPGKPKHSQLRIWTERILWGGRGRGDGHTFRHNPRAEGQLRALASDLLAAAS